MNTNYIQTVKQVFAKQALLHTLFEILVCRCNHPHIDLDRCVTSDAVERTIGEHAQQSGLQLCRHVADFVEKQGPAVRLFEAALTRRLGAGKCTAIMPKQLAFEQVTGDRRGVERDEGLVGARTVTMQGTGDQLLASA